MKGKSFIFCAFLCKDVLERNWIYDMVKKKNHEET